MSDLPAMDSPPPNARRFPPLPSSGADEYAVLPGAPPYTSVGWYRYGARWEQTSVQDWGLIAVLLARLDAAETRLAMIYRWAKEAEDAEDFTRDVIDLARKEPT